ncbi:MAG: hypothetical protein E7406_02220 [Ruminococcaceae bacterium]|nr:hypothetical protein [Oscillospiraceae bacterium]
MRKNLKKLTAFVMSVIVLATMSLSAMAMPNYTFDTAKTDGLMPVKEVLFAEDFNGSADLGVANAVWGASSGGSNTLSVISRTSNSDSLKNFLWVQNVENEQYYKAKSDTAFKGDYTIEFKFNKTVNHSNGDTCDNMFFGAGYTDGTNESLAINLGIGADDKPYYVNAEGTKVPFITNTKAWTAGFDIYSNWTWDEGDWTNQKSNTVTAEFGRNTASWYTVKVDVNTQAGTYDVYLNGALCVEDAAFIPAAGIDWADTGINLPYVMEADYNVGVRYVYDDLYIYRDYEGITNIYAEDFNEYAEAKSWSSGSLNKTGIAGLGIANIVDKSGTITATGNQLVATYNGGASGAIANGLIADDYVTIDLDFTVSGVPEGATDNWVPIVGITGAPNGGGIVFKVNENGNIGFHWYNQTGAAVKNIGTVTLGEKHDLTLHIDFTTGRYTIYVDGNLLLYKEAMSNGSQAANIVNGEGYAIVLGHKDAATATVAYDNIRVYKDVREEVLEELSAELSKIFVNDNFVMKQVVLPDTITGFDGYKVSWSTEADSNVQVGADGKTATVKQTTNNQNIKLTATVTDVNGEYTVSRNFTVRVVAGANNIISDNGAGTITATGRQTPQGSILYLAIYDNSTDTLVGLVPAETISNNTITATYDYSKLAAGTYYAKAMLFDKATIAPHCVTSRVITVVVE